MKTINRHFFNFIFVFVFCGLALPVAAQGVLEEVVVTAQKREQNIQDVGISISAFTGDQMKALGFQESMNGDEIAGSDSGDSDRGGVGCQPPAFARCTTVPNVMPSDPKEGHLLRVSEASYLSDSCDQRSQRSNPPSPNSSLSAMPTLTQML